LVEGFGGDLVEFGQVAVEHELLGADQVDAARDELRD